MKVLIVEDETSIGLALDREITRAGYQVIGPAHSTGEGLLLARQMQPSLALIDLDPRYMGDGIRLARALEKFGIPCLFMSQSPGQAARASTAALGVISKPINFEEIPAALDVAREIIAGGKPPPPPLPQMLTVFR